MTPTDDSETRLTRLETRVDLLFQQVFDKKPEKKSWLARWLSASGLRDLLFLFGLPAATVVAYESLDSKVLNPGKYREIAERSVAVEKVTQLQELNEEIYVLQAEDRDNVAYAKIEARRGQVQRLTDDLYELWAKYPDVYGLHESYAVAEALLLQGWSDQALAVTDGVDISALTPLNRIDHLTLRARILFAGGPGHDPEAARDALRTAVDLVPAMDGEGAQTRMYEKLVSIRLLNEDWLGTPCAETAQLATGLQDLSSDDMPPDRADPVRLNTLAVLDAHQMRCGSG